VIILDPTDDKKTGLGDTAGVGVATDSTAGTADVATPAGVTTEPPTLGATPDPVVPTPQPAAPVAPAAGVTDTTTADTTAPVEAVSTPDVAATPEPTTSPVATPDKTGEGTDTTGGAGAGGLGAA